MKFWFSECTGSSQFEFRVRYSHSLRNNKNFMKERILYIDNLRAFAIMLVVMGHILQFTFGDSHGFDHPFFKFIYSFHMPLFFFISGMFAKGFTPPIYCIST